MEKLQSFLKFNGENELKGVVRTIRRDTRHFIMEFYKKNNDIFFDKLMKITNSELQE